MQIRRTKEFAKWLRDRRDMRGRAKIFDRLDRLADGNPGKARGVGAGIVELKIDYGPLWYRVYYVQRGELLILLLL
jgi:putative addiction module killer protein